MATDARSILLYQCMTKATRVEGDQRQYGLNWAFSRRGRLKVFGDHLESGDWRVDYADIKAAKLFSFRSMLFIPAYVLTVETEQVTYHFGLNGNKFWKGELPFAVERERGKLRYSWLSLVARAILLVCLLNLLWQWWMGR